MLGRLEVRLEKRILFSERISDYTDRMADFRDFLDQLEQGKLCLWLALPAAPSRRTLRPLRCHHTDPKLRLGQSVRLLVCQHLPRPSSGRSEARQSAEHLHRC